MFDITKFFGKGLKNTVMLKNGANLSYHGPWKKITEDTLLDRWLVGDFCAAEYTIVADLSTFQKEIVKCLVVAGPSTAELTVYGRSNLGNEIISLSATVNDSYVNVIVNAKPLDDSAPGRGAKCVFSANYYQTQNFLVPA
jgi:hypothetical protein|tara:strand:- start:1940 stop:2359 length:420 start_codon:yes stop_codon:yes gene_type:complete